MKKRLIAWIIGMSMIFGVVGCGEGKVYRASDMSKYIKLGQYEGFEVEMDLEVTDEEVQEEVQAMLQDYAEYEQIMEGTVASGSAVNINYSGILEGETEPFEGGTGTDYDITVGTHRFIGTFEEQLIGHKPGETFNVKTTFPADYGVEELNGKNVDFTVTINYLCGKKVVPEWNDEFVLEKIGEDYSTTEDYEKYIKDQLASQKKQEAEINRQSEITKKILENAEIIEYDKEEVEKQYNDCINYYTEMASTYYGCTLAELTENLLGEDEETFKKEAKEAAYQYVVGNLAWLAIAYDQNMSITQKEYDERLKALADEYNYENPEQIEKELADQGENYLWDQFLREKAMEYVLGSDQEG